MNTEGLINALQHKDPAYRKRAAAALRAMNARHAVSALKAAAAVEEDDAARKAIENAIAALSKDAAPQRKKGDRIDDLLKELDSNNLDRIIAAAQQLGELGDTRAVEPLVMLFANNRLSIHARLAIAEALLKLESAPLEVTLLANLRNTEWQIRRNGAAILGQLKADWAVEPLATVLNDSHPIVRRTARAALKHIGTPEARAALAHNEAENPNINATGNRDRKDDQMPAAPTYGLLQRIKDKKDNNRPPAAKSPTRPLSYEGHKAPTRPLDPSVVEEAEKRHRQQDDDKE